MSEAMKELSTAKDVLIPPDAIHCISGLIYKVLKSGRGNLRPGPDDMVRVIFRALTETGLLLDSSGDDDKAKTMSVRQAIPALSEALQLMTTGQIMRIWIPPRLSSDMLHEAKNEMVIFDIELVEFTRMKEYPSLPIELISPRKEE